MALYSCGQNVVVVDVISVGVHAILWSKYNLKDKMELKEKRKMQIGKRY